MVLGRAEIEMRQKLCKEIKDLIDTEKQTFKNACKIVSNNTKYSVGTLQRSFYRFYPERNSGKHGALTKEQEAGLLAACQAYSIANYALSASEIRQTAEGMIKKKLGRGWGRDFLTRKAKFLSGKTCKALSGKRCGEEVMEDVKTFIISMESFLSTHSFSEKSILNFDETLICDSKSTLEVKRAEIIEKQRGETKQKRSQTVGSLITFVSAKGELIYLVYCLRASLADFSDPEIGKLNIVLQKTGKKSVQRDYIFTESGRVDSTCVLAIVDGFYRQWNLYYPGLHCLVYSDQLAAHRTLELLKKNMARGVWLCSLPANTSHFTQPLDDVPFAVFKRLLRIQHQQLLLDLYRCSEDVFTNTLLKTSYAIERKAFSPNTINPTSG